MSESLGVLYYIKLECVGCGSAHLLPVYQDGPHWSRVCEVCDSLGTNLAPVEFTIQGVADSIGQE